MAVFRTSISGKNDVRLFYQLVAVRITLMFLIIFSYRFCVREIVSSAVVSIIFGFCMWFGTVFSNKESWNYFLRNKYVKILDIWYILAYTLLMFGALLIIGKIVAASGNKAEQKAEVKTKAKTKDKTVRNTRKVFLCVLQFYLFAGCRIISYSGQDSSTQIFRHRCYSIFMCRPDFRDMI